MNEQKINPTKIIVKNGYGREVSDLPNSATMPVVGEVEDGTYEARPVDAVIKTNGEIEEYYAKPLYGIRELGWKETQAYRIIPADEKDNETIESQIQENFQILDEVFKDADISAFYKSLVKTMIEHYVDTRTTEIKAIIEGRIKYWRDRDMGSLTDVVISTRIAELNHILKEISK